MRFSLLVTLVVLFTLIGCTKDYTITTDEHKQEVNEWHDSRIESLKAERGWLKLAGLYWLDEGESSFGAAEDNTLAFPDGSIADNAGTVSFDGESITLTPDDDVEILMDGAPLSESVTFSKDESPEFMHGRIAWTFIARGELTGLRLFDQESPVYTNFTGIEQFPVNQDWRVVAKLIPNSEPTTIPIINILGQTTHEPSPGKLEFTIDGETHSLAAIESGERLFLIVGDETNRSTTFQGGRYMYVDNPGPNGKVVVDFNKAYNPPCSFSEYTTCQLPPPENRLSLEIEAGEKRYKNQPEK